MEYELEEVERDYVEFLKEMGEEKDNEALREQAIRIINELK